MSYPPNWSSTPTFQQGYFNTYPYLSPGSAQAFHGPVQPPVAVDTSTSETESEQTSGYSYFVKMINPKKKSDFVVRMWHDEHSQFKSPAELKIKLLDTFPEDISNTQDFQVGYFEPPGSTKRRILSNRDIVAMYTTFKPGSKINLWCDRKINSGDEEENEKEKEKEIFAN